MQQFLGLQDEYRTILYDRKDNWCWIKTDALGGSVAKIKNTSMGTLLSNLSEGMDWDKAVRKYEVIVAPTNYKRPKAIFTKRMVQEAQKTVEEMGLKDSLGRRFATLEDITINNILFADRDIEHLVEDVFEELMQETSVSPDKFDKVHPISISDFMENIVPKATGMELLFENSHIPNLFSLIAPETPDSKNMFKWDNNFSWAYRGNIADSMKERVKAAGGSVDGVLRFSIQWNVSGDNLNDYDAHCKEPNGNDIYFRSAGRPHPSGGILDVDARNFGRNHVAVENITWQNANKMKEGVYTFSVHNFEHLGGTDGFDAEIEFNGKIYKFEHHKNVPNNKTVAVAKVEFSKANGIKILNSLPSTESAKTIWDISTNSFHPVSVMMHSPNYWDEQDGIGNKHYFFSLSGCKNEDTPNGFFNEYLDERLMEHKKVFAALGSKMRVEQSDSQISGLGFSSTKRNSVVCKVATAEGTRLYKVVF